MPRAAVLGSPIAHSLSPTLHRAAYAAAGLTQWSYDRVEVRSEELAGFVAHLDQDWRGLSLTMPLKEIAFGVARTTSEMASRAGAINTLVRRADGGWDATNTDVEGIVRSLAAVPHDGRATVLGSGATARSAVLALDALGVGEIEVAARNRPAAQRLAEWARALGIAVTPADLHRKGAAQTALTVSTLPPAASSTVGDLIAAGQRLDGTTVLDVVYANWPTPLAAAAQRQGAQVISGLDMLVHQAAAQFALFTGVVADVDAMFAAGRAAITG